MNKKIDIWEKVNKSNRLGEKAQHLNKEKHDVRLIEHKEKHDARLIEQRDQRKAERWTARQSGLKMLKSLKVLQESL